MYRNGSRQTPPAHGAGMGLRGSRGKAGGCKASQNNPWLEGIWLLGSDRHNRLPHPSPSCLRALRKLPERSNFSTRQNGLRSVGSHLLVLPHTAAGCPDPPPRPQLHAGCGRPAWAPTATLLHGPGELRGERTRQPPALFCFSQEEASSESIKRPGRRQPRRATAPHARQQEPPKSLLPA